MRDLAGIQNAEFEKRLRANALDMLFALDRIAPEGSDERKLVDEVRGSMQLRMPALSQPRAAIVQHAHRNV